jgi:hypothetical protein
VNPHRLIKSDDVVVSRYEDWEPSPISTINDIEVVAYLTQFAKNNSVGMLEPHADWNSLMGSPALQVQGAVSTFEGVSMLYPGSELTFVLENGTSVSNRWYAMYRPLEDTGPLATSGDFYNFFVMGRVPASYKPRISTPTVAQAKANAVIPTTNNNAANITLSSWFNVSSGAYPSKPDINQTGFSVSGPSYVTGYMLRDQSIAVLSIPKFTQSRRKGRSFSRAVKEFIDKALKEKMSRVIIDLQQNSGGSAELAFITFKQFFPDLEPFAGSRRRIHAMADTLGEAITAHATELQETIKDQDFNKGLPLNEWFITNRINAATNTTFGDWGEYSGPVTAHGDKFSLMVQYPS